MLIHYLTLDRKGNLGVDLAESPKKAINAPSMCRAVKLWCVGTPPHSGGRDPRQSWYKRRIPGDINRIITSWCPGHKHSPSASESHLDWKEPSEKAGALNNDTNSTKNLGNSCYHNYQSKWRDSPRQSPHHFHAPETFCPAGLLAVPILV